MDLKDFIKNVLTDVDRAVDEARDSTSRDIRFSDNATSRTIEFDIAVSAESSDKKSGKAGVRVLQFAEGGGEIAKENKNATVSRIVFGLHIDTSTKRERAEDKAEVQRLKSQQKSVEF